MLTKLVFRCLKKIKVFTFWKVSSRLSIWWHCLPRSLQVPEDIHKQYMTGGRAEKAKLLKMFIDSGFDKAP